MLIDVTRLVSRLLDGLLPTGVDRVSLAYIEHFRSRARALVRFGGRWVEFGPESSQRIFTALLAPDAHSRAMLRRSVAARYLLRWASAGRTVLVNAGHSGLEHPSYAARVRARHLRPVFFLHDLIPITHPEYSRPGEAQRHLLRLRTMIDVGRGIVVNSEATRDALVRHAQGAGWRLPPLAVAALGTSRLPQPASARPLPGPYFVVLGTIEPRKNHLLLLHLWRELAQDGAGPVPSLVLIGRRGWECEQVVDMLERCTPLRGRVVEEADCGDARLATWLHHARALLFPSFAEGFGMPLVEALASGVPAIASDLPAFREVAGSIPETLDPLDGAGWKRAIRAYTEADSPARAAQMQRLAAFRAPTWEEHFARVEDLLERTDA